MPGDVKSFVLALAAVVAVLLTATSARAATVKETFEKYDLLGTLASDCAKPADAKSPYLTNRIIDADHVELDKMVGPTSRESATIVDKATESKPNELTLSATIDDKRYDLHVQVEHGRVRVTEQTRADGQKVIAGGQVAAGGAETPWYGRCLQKITIRNAPGGGDKCIDVPHQDFKPGKPLQMWDCNDGAAQTFAFDAFNGRLGIGDLCVEAHGRGERRDPVQLARCNGAPNQTWKTEAIGDVYRMTGINGLCIDVPHHSKENGTLLWLWQCHTDWSDKWVLGAVRAEAK